MITAKKFLALSPDQVTSEAEKEFFASLKLRNGTYKTTFQGRFSEINRELRQLVGSGDITVDHILDIGISSGSNTLELYSALESAGHKSRIIGTDLMTEAYLVDVLPGCLALVDSTGYPLRYDIFKWSMKPWVVRSDYRTCFFIFRKLINISLGYRARKIIAAANSTRVQKVELVTPMLRKHASIIVKKDDITRYNRTFDGKFNFIRAANVLNRGYFTDDDLRTIIYNIKRYLVKPAASLLVMRTHENNDNHGTLFDIEEDGGCRILRRFGKGSEVEDLVLECMRKKLS
ncbi:ATP/GTP-binding protein [Rhodanobacter terrae]|uniref:ATP/GTP-binding protein n=1 Tax=Rhodanobacter terrae TaxID=418647 RepID=A0ABW0SYK0_9GAMM